MSGFSWGARVYWEDTDGGAIVYYANYIKFMERARSEWLRAIGIEQLPLQRELGLMFVVVEATSTARTIAPRSCRRLNPTSAIQTPGGINVHHAPVSSAWLFDAQ